MGADLSKGFDKFQKCDDSRDEHLDSLLRAIMAHEQQTGTKIDANFVTWRGMMTKVYSHIRTHAPTFLNVTRSWQPCLSKMMGRLRLIRLEILSSDQS